MVQKLDRMKDEGNQHFKSGRYKQAVETYSQALEVDPSNKLTNSKILQNRAICHTKLKDYPTAIADATRALELDPSYTKAQDAGKGHGRIRQLGRRGARAEAGGRVGSVGRGHRARDPRRELELKKSKRKDYYKILTVDRRTRATRRSRRPTGNSPSRTTRTRTRTTRRPRSGSRTSARRTRR